MSSTFTVDLPAELRPLLEAEAAEHGFAGVAEYLAALVRSNVAQDHEDPAVEAALLEGLASGSVREADAEFWSDVRRRARDAAHRTPPRD